MRATPLYSKSYTNGAASAVTTHSLSEMSVWLRVVHHSALHGFAADRTAQAVARALRDYCHLDTWKEVLPESESSQGRRALVLTLSVRSVDFLVWSRHVEVHTLGPHFARPRGPVVTVPLPRGAKSLVRAAQSQPGPGPRLFKPGIEEPQRPARRRPAERTAAGTATPSGADSGRHGDAQRSGQLISCFSGFMNGEMPRNGESRARLVLISAHAIQPERTQTKFEY
jgi:hypothetical protein